MRFGQPWTGLLKGALVDHSVHLRTERLETAFTEFPDMDERRFEALARGFVGSTHFTERYHCVGFGNEFLRHYGKDVPFGAKFS